MIKGLIMQQGTVSHLAVSLDLLLWPIPNMENSRDTRYLSLATSDDSLNCRRVRNLVHSLSLTYKPSLPGTPLWLAAVYTNSFASVNKYWVPAMW